MSHSMSFVKIASLALGGLVLVTAGTVACSVNDTYINCGEGYEEGCPGGPPDAGADASLPECPGPCVPAPPIDWSDPVLLWVGIPGEAPACPEGAPVTGYNGHAGLVEPPELACPICSCEPPNITCEVPVGWETNAGASCPGAAPHLSFDAPAGWDGACTTENALAAGMACPIDVCVKGLSIDAPVAKSGACNPKAEEPSGFRDMVWSWQLEAKACKGEGYPECPGLENACTPPVVKDFFTCVYREDDNECPPDWPVKQVFYEGVDDMRTCTDCACGDATGASCAVLATAYSDGACSDVVTSNLLSSDTLGQFCVSMAMPGTALGSKSASITSLVPGSCAPSGGVPAGTATPRKPSTFCCRD